MGSVCRQTTYKTTGHLTHHLQVINAHPCDEGGNHTNCICKPSPLWKTSYVNILTIENHGSPLSYTEPHSRLCKKKMKMNVKVLKMSFSLR